jgi:hypothetical protein
MKLTGWYRIGIVLSVLWCFIIIGFVVYQYYTGTYDYHSILISYVEDTSQPSQSLQRIKLVNPQGKEIILDPVVVNNPVLYNPIVNYTMVLLLLIVPVVSGWILVFTIIWTIKWVIRGFKSHS